MYLKQLDFGVLVSEGDWCVAPKYTTDVNQGAANAEGAATLS